MTHFMIQIPRNHVQINTILKLSEASMPSDAPKLTALPHLKETKQPLQQ